MIRAARSLLVLVAVVAAVGGAPAARGAGLVTLRVASNLNDDVTPLLYAEHAGLFEKAGIRVAFSQMNSGAAVTAAVLGGSIDIGKSSLLPLISAHARGLPISIVSPGELWLRNSPISALVASKTVSIASAKDLTGKTVAVMAVRDLSEMALRDWIDEHGGDSKAVRIVEVPGTAISGALSDGRADAANVTGPTLSEVLASNKVYVVARPDDTVGSRFLLTAWFASDAFLDANHDVVARFARVMQQAAAYTNTHHAETVPLTAPFWGIEPSVLARIPRATISNVLDPKEIQPVIDLAAKYQVIAQPFDASLLISKYLRR